MLNVKRTPSRNSRVTPGWSQKTSITGFYN